MGTNYYAVRNRPSVSEPIHIGKSSAGWMFLFKTQELQFNDPPAVWHSYREVTEWLDEYVGKRKLYVIMDEYDEEIKLEEFYEMIENKQKITSGDYSRRKNFTYCDNVDGYRFSREEFC